MRPARPSAGLVASALSLSASAFATSAGVAAVAARASKNSNGALRVRGATSFASNSTHCGWIDGGGGGGSAEGMDLARSAMVDYLRRNLMPYDAPRARTLGFDEPRLDHRQLLFDALRDTLANDERPRRGKGDADLAAAVGAQIKEAVKSINTRPLSLLVRDPSRPTAFDPGLGIYEAGLR